MDWTHYSIMKPRGQVLKARIAEVKDGIARIIDETGKEHGISQDRIHMMWAPLPKKR
ncbi:MAG: hypothetical protein ACRCXB_18530 [Aeromonadaceae bacterium]|jgi:hypothetical protein